MIHLSKIAILVIIDHFHNIFTSIPKEKLTIKTLIKIPKLNILPNFLNFGIRSEIPAVISEIPKKRL